MSQKTYCDRCGAECPNYRARLSVTEEHSTSKGEPVSEGYMERQKDLCTHCCKSLEEWFGKSLGLLGDEALYQLRQQREAEMEPGPVLRVQDTLGVDMRAHL